MLASTINHEFWDHQGKMGCWLKGSVCSKNQATISNQISSLNPCPQLQLKALRGNPRNCIRSWEAAAGKLQCHRAVTSDLHLFCTEQIGRNASFQPVWRSPYRMSALKSATFCLFSLPGGGWSADTKLVSVHWSGRHRVCHIHWFISSAHEDKWTWGTFTEAETW